ncbi:MAG: transglutaminase family protein [Vulcanimicrobiaceae bacterium]
MISYTVRHRTAYSYQQDVAYSRLVAHLAPRPTPRQETRAFAVCVTPAPVQSFERKDFFGNRTDWFTIDEPHAELEIMAESRVEVARASQIAPETSPSWESVRRALELPEDPEALEALQYTFDTPLTRSSGDAVEYALPSFRAGRPLLASLLELNSRIYADFKYDKDATDTSTTVEQVFELRAGVCQDLAHVGIAAVRSVGLAARYVSGYLLTHPPAGRERHVGADASHAWFAVWVPPFGWIDFDPTNDRLPSDEHITVAWGRDYGDVAPIHGIITGGSEHEVDVAVDVAPSDDTPGIRAEGVRLA